MNKLTIDYKQFNKIIHNAYWARYEIDSRLQLDDSAINCYTKHFKDKIKHPTTGMLAMRDISKKPLNYPMAYNTKINILEKQITQTAKLTQEFNNLINTLYPKTRKIREYIINHDKVVIGEIKKTSGISLINNLIYRLLRK